MTDEQHSEERLEPPDRIAINPSVAARYPVSDRRIGDIEYVRASVAAPQGDVNLGAGIMKEVTRYNDGNGCTRRQLVDSILILISQARAPSVTAPVSTGEQAELQSLRDENKRLRDHIADLNHDLDAAVKECNEHHG